MNDVINYNSRPINTKIWKQRIPYIPKERETMSKEPGDYNFQSSVLFNDLTSLKDKKSYILNKTNQYLEVDFLNNNISQDYLSFLSDRGLENVNVFRAGFGSQLYFKINNYENAIEYLSESINDLNKYSIEEITKDDLKEKRISLWKSFRLSTPEIKEKASPYIIQFDRLRIDIDFIEKQELSYFSQQILTSAKEEGIELEIINNSLYIEDIPDGVRKTKKFLEQLSRLDNIRSIVLSEFVSFVENYETGLEKEISNVNIKQPPKDCPVIAVIDTGVAKGFLTENILLEGLDYTNKKGGPTNGNPYADELDHGTGVACEIIYGKNTVDYFITKKAKELIPLFKIFPVKVFSSKKSTMIDYEKIFSLTGDFASAIKKYNIKIVNMSLGSAEPKDFNDNMLSKSGHIIDTFASTLNVIFVVSVGNILPNILNQLTKKYPNLTFYKEPKDLIKNKSRLEKEINISTPADLVSGIAVGSCVEQKNKYAVSSFSKLFSLEQSGYTGKPDVLSIGGGDWPIDLITTPHLFHFSLNPALIISNDFSRFKCIHGTSFSTPRISRALGFCQMKYPDMSVENMRGLLLHKLSNFKISPSKLGITNTNGHAKKLEEISTSFQKNTCKFNKSFCGNGVLTKIEEDILLSDNDDEITLLIEGSVKSKQIVTYEVPISKLLGNATRNRTNKLKVKLSVSILPTLFKSKDITLHEANKFHVSAIAHKRSVSPTTEKPWGKKTLTDQCISNNNPGIILKWTSDYNSKFNPTFKTVEKEYIKDDLIKILGEDDTIYISVRGINKDDKNETKNFAIIFSIEDLGATGQIRNKINIKLEI